MSTQIAVRPFDVADYQASPGKYRLFRTARIAETIQSSPHLTAGRFVRLSLHSEIVNVARGGVRMPVYAVTPAPEDGVEPADPVLVFACALGDFVL